MATIGAKAGILRKEAKKSIRITLDPTLIKNNIFFRKTILTLVVLITSCLSLHSANENRDFPMKNNSSKENHNGNIIHTLIVAPHGSKFKGTVDFVCDGIDDQREIQSAIDSLAANGGGRVLLLDGNFNISMSIKPKKNCILSGKGENTILRLMDAPQTTLVTEAKNGETKVTVSNILGFKSGMGINILDEQHLTTVEIKAIEGNNLLLDAVLKDSFAGNAKVGAAIPVVCIDSQDDIVIEKLTIDGNRAGQMFFNETYDYSIIKESQYGHPEFDAAILIKNKSNRVIIRECYIYNTFGHAIFAFEQGFDMKFIENTILDIGDKGIAIATNQGGRGLIQGNWIVKCGFAKNRTPKKWTFGDCVNIHAGGDEWIITNNHLSNAYRFGIYLFQTQKSIISNNYISDCQNRCGIWLANTSDNIIAGNIITNNKIGIQANPKTINHITIDGNIICKNSSDGILLENASESIIKGNKISDNKGNGISILKSSSLSVIENSIINNCKYGIYLDALLLGIVANNIVSSNLNNKQESIYLKSSSRISLSGNICSCNRESMDDSIKISEDCSHIEKGCNIPALNKSISQ